VEQPAAANLPTKAPAPIGAESGYYFWLNGMYDSVRLPSYQLGYRNVGAGAGGPPQTSATCRSLLELSEVAEFGL
jgi:hypothetical protein